MTSGHRYMYTYWERGCFLCGRLVGDRDSLLRIHPESAESGDDSDGPDPDHWVTLFRLIHPEARVSGVGERDMEQCRQRLYRAPVDKDAGPGASLARDDDHVVAFIRPDPSPPEPTPESFLIHDVCWQLLEKLYHPCPVPIQRLWDVLNSIPTYGDCVPSWGHDYRLAPHWRGRYIQYPWRDCDLYGPERSYNWDKEASDANPRHVTDELASRLAGPCTVPDGEEWALGSSDESQDVFFQLPAEIRLEIAVLLSIEDALGLRMASKAFTFVFYDQAFWASRFRTLHGERSWLLGADGDISHTISTGKPGTDWRRLFHQTPSVSIGPATTNLQRIWSLAKQLRVVLDLEFCGGPEMAPPQDEDPAAAKPIASSTTDADTRKRLDAIEWSYQPSVGEFEDASFQMHTRLVYVPDDLSRISFSFVTLGGERYLAGMVFHTRETDEILRLGYRNPSETPLSVDIRRGFCGFVLWAGSRGIRALRCVDSDGRPGEWVGEVPRNASKLDCPETSRLACRSHTKVLAVKAEFDALRITGLSVASEYTIRVFEEKPFEFDEGAFTLKENAVWYPRLEDPYLRIWDEHTLHAGRLCQGYKPLTWICFGGQGGAYLRHITKMSVLLYGKAFPKEFTIKFSYKGSEGGVPKGQGEHAMLSTRPTGFPHLEVPFEDFSIDGPGGEFITNIGILMTFFDGFVRSAYRRRDFEGHGFPLGIEVQTNRGRSKVFTLRTDVVRSGQRDTYYLAPTGNEAPILGLYAGEPSKPMGFQLGVLGPDVEGTKTPDGHRPLWPFEEHAASIALSGLKLD